MEHMDIQAVIFDMDGVIFDSERLYLEYEKKVAQAHQFFNEEEVAKKCIGVTEEETRRIHMEAYGSGFSYDIFRSEIMAEFEKRPDKSIPLKPGVFELLHFLQQKKLPIAIASSTQTIQVRAELTDAEIISFFQHIVGGDQVGRSKPAPDIFLRAAQKLEKEPQKCLVIEDSHIGIRAAHAAKMIPIMVPDLLEPTKEMHMLATQILPSLTAVRDYLDQALAW